MRNLLLLSFDYFRPGEPAASYPLACLSASVLGDPNLGREWAVDVASIDLYREVPVSSRGLERLVSRKARFAHYDAVAFGDYCWSSRYVQDLLAFLAQWQPRARVLAGGYQVTSTPEAELERHYPAPAPGNITFLKGFAESSLLTALRSIAAGEVPARVLQELIDCKKLQSPWLSGELALEPGTDKVRWETKRGCLYSCDYCEFKAALNRPKPGDGMVLSQDRLLEELELFRRSGVKKVNVLDPLFNIDGTYEHLLEPMLRSGLSFTLQTRVEHLEDQPDLLEAAKANPRLHLEIGVQTLDDELNRLLCRGNRKDVILSNLERLKRAGVSFETNLIFGIPGQSPSSHLADIEALIEAGCPKRDILCFPLRIPRGSRLEKMKGDLHVEELPYGTGAALVVKADGFGQLDWLRMLLISEADEDHLARAKRMLADDGAAPAESWTGKYSWFLDAGTWLEALERNGYRFRVMILNPEGTFTLHCESETLEFLIEAPRRPAVRLGPGSLQAHWWIRFLLGKRGLINERRYVILEREWRELKYPRPARIIDWTLDVASRAVVIRATWRLDVREQLVLLWWRFARGRRARAPGAG